MKVDDCIIYYLLFERIRDTIVFITTIYLFHSYNLFV